MSSLTGGTGFNSSRSNTGAFSGSRGAGDIIPKGYRKGQLQQFSPEQMNLFKELFSHVAPGSYLSKLSGGDEETFQNIEAPMQRDFSAQLGGLASRFSGMGGLGARQSSGFQNTATAAASNFQQDLMSRRQELQRQALSDLLGISGSLLGQRPNEQFLAPKSKKKSFLEQIFGGASEGIGSAIGGLGSKLFGL